MRMHMENTVVSKRKTIKIKLIDGMRLMLVAAGVILFIWFVIPLCLSVNLNLGNMTGLAVSFVMILYGIFMKWVHRKFAECRKHPFMRRMADAFLIFVGMIACLVIIESVCMIRAAYQRPAEDATVVVLGCRVYGERPSLSMRERLEAAYDYLEENESAKCILSGGQGYGENISEAECMYRWLMDKGIDPKRLYKEENSASTRENLDFSAQVIEEAGLNPQIAIVTSEYHQYRAGRIAKSLNMEYGAVPAKTAIWLFPTFYVRELYGILYEWIL